MVKVEDQFCSLRRKVLEKYYSKMNDMQRRAVFQVQGPLLILAGAGSGKTTVLINRIEYMVRFGDAYHSQEKRASSLEALGALEAYLNQDDGDITPLVPALACEPIKPWNILAITFTNKAAGELRSRLEEKLGNAASDIQASTFHSLCVRILRREIGTLGYNSSFTIYDSDDSMRVIKEGLKVIKVDEKVLAPRAVLSEISRAKDRMESPADMLSRAGDDYRLQCIARVYDYYQIQLKTANALDFDDIILFVVRIFQQFPDVLAHYQNRYKYIMVDEYQDTNHTQYLLISLLASGHSNLCVVGDDDQSIYKFRGATIENILSFETQFEAAEVIRLEQNYRSTQNILNAANEVIAHNLTRKGKNLWTDAGQGDKIQLHRAHNEIEESKMVAKIILDHVNAGDKYSDHAILYRMNAQSNSLEKALAKNAIPYRIIGGLRFYERKEIKDMVAYLSIMNNPSDSLRFLRVINEPKRGIGNATLSAAQEIADTLGMTLFEVMKEAEKYVPLAKKSALLQGFTTMVEELAQMAEQEPLADVLDALLDRSGYAMALRTQGFEGQTRLENIMELKSNLLKYTEESEEPTLAGFLEEIALYTDLDNYDPDSDAVVLMTVHSAKGLEFPYVFIAGMDEGIFPGRQSSYYPEELEEERRLAYVAITRAKKQLFVTCTERRMIFGQTSFNRPSRFVAEIPAELVECHEPPAIAKKPVLDRAAAKRAHISLSSTTIGVGDTSHERTGSVSFAVGDLVRHRVFGEGKVLSARPMGGDSLVEIRFDKVGVKKVMANFAGLTKN
ncbi:UvrD-helicase domain-containing protein [Oscillospiraceae bacterium MB08-C2-2]|nr:UvrD-helicase domain-containing protein [Oscillospiraceae bacterium MB08-C2-2]